jgi:hypothetical protein
LVKWDVAMAAGRTRMTISVCLQRTFIGIALMLFCFVSIAHAEMASVYGGRDGYCGSRTASKLLSNDSSSSPTAIWNSGSRLSQQMRHSSN